MVLVEWEDRYSVEVDRVDDQHKNLLNMVNELHDAMKEGEGREKIGDILSEMKDYTEYHFNSEEELMREYDYPEDKYQEQLDEHQKFVEKISEFSKDYENGKLTVSMKVLDFLKNWLQNHILKVDSKLQPYFKDEDV